jgi:ribulose-5-phosphate 4-epimerase/fuculose-1-phosphate aldolase
LDYDDTIFHRADVVELRHDLALSLRAAAHHGLAEGVCNHFSIMLDGNSGLFLINPHGLMWSEVGPDDVVLVDELGRSIAGAHGVERTAMFIHAAIHKHTGRKCVLHTHMPHATALALTSSGRLNTRLSQTAMRFHGRVAVDPDYNGLAFDETEGERIAATLGSADVAFLANHGVVVCGENLAFAYDDLYYLERACQIEVLARSTGEALRNATDEIAESTAAQFARDRDQSALFFRALRRELPFAGRG